MRKEGEKEGGGSLLTEYSFLRSVDKGLLLSPFVVLAACVARRDVLRAFIDEPPCINTVEEAEEEKETNALGLRPVTKTLLLQLLKLLSRRLLAVRTAVAEAARVFLVG
jgi:hypothetical protein